MRPNAARRQIHDFGQQPFQLVFVNFTGAERIQINSQRPRDADRISQLNHRLVRQTGRDNIFCQITCRIRCGPVDLCRVFSRKSASAVSHRAAVSVNDDFPSRQPRIAVRPADDKTPRRIYIKLFIVNRPAVRQQPVNNPANRLTDFIIRNVFGMLCRYDDRIHVDGRPFS